MRKVDVMIKQAHPVKVSVEEGTNLLDAVRQAGIAIDSPCNGNGSCGKCLVRILEGQTKSKNLNALTQKDRDLGLTLACQEMIKSTLTIEIPEQSRLSNPMQITDMSDREKQTLEKIRKKYLRDGMQEAGRFRTIHLDLPEPTLEDNLSDDERIRRAFRMATGYQAILPFNFSQKIVKAIRENEKGIELLYEPKGHQRAVLYDVKPFGQSVQPYGVSIDIGTTSVAALLVDLETSQILEKVSTGNTQASFGADVINRIVYAEKPDGLKRLQKEIIENTINPLIDSLVLEAGIEKDQIVDLSIAGNTTMIHLLMGISPEYLRREPYIPGITRVDRFEADRLKLHVNPETKVQILPSVASYVGGDITSGVFAVPIWQQEDMTMLVDLGTNGEIVFGNQDFMMCCACSAGPAFEGGEISCGSRALPGAIESIAIGEDFTPVYSTIADEPARSICGSGIIDLICEMKRVGIIDGRGKITKERPHERIFFDDYGIGRYILKFEDESGEEVSINEVDIDNFIKAKGAVFSAINTLLRSMDMPIEALSAIYIAGGIGTNINIANAIKLGMLPDIDQETYFYIGNSSLQGAYLAMVLKEGEAKVRELADNMTYIELSADPSYMDDFISACFIPHTDRTLFPSCDI